MPSWAGALLVVANTHSINSAQVNGQCQCECVCAPPAEVVFVILKALLPTVALSAVQHRIHPTIGASTPTDNSNAKTASSQFAE